MGLWGSVCLRCIIYISFDHGKSVVRPCVEDCFLASRKSAKSHLFTYSVRCRLYENCLRCLLETIF